MKHRGQLNEQNTRTATTQNMFSGSGSAASSGAAGGGSASTVSPLEELIRRKGVDEAWNTIEEMQRQGLFIDRFTISRMLMKTVGDGRSRWNPTKVYRGIALVERFIQMQPEEADEVLFNALLETCCRMKDLRRLETTLQHMKDLQIYPSHVTLGILVKAYGQANDVTRVLKVWDEMAEQRRQANAVTHGCMIDACVKCGQVKTAIKIFHDMKRQKKHRNTILYTTLIKGYGIEKDLRNALTLFREMKDEGVPYNTITYNSIIDVCIRCSDVQQAEDLLREMLAPGSSLEPDLITYSTLLKGYCHVGDLDKALQVAETIKARGLKCDELVYNTLMDGCVKANDLSAGIGLFAEMTSSGMKPSSISHSILVRLYQRNGYKADAVDAVAQLYQHHGIDRPSAGSERSGKSGRRGDKQRNQTNAANIPTTAENSSGGCRGGDWGSANRGASQQQGNPPPQGNAPPPPPQPGQQPLQPGPQPLRPWQQQQEPCRTHSGSAPQHPPGVLVGPGLMHAPYAQADFDPARSFSGPYPQPNAVRAPMPCGVQTMPAMGSIAPEPVPCGMATPEPPPQCGRYYAMPPARQMQHPSAPADGAHNGTPVGTSAASGMAPAVQWRYGQSAASHTGSNAMGAPGAGPSRQAPNFRINGTCRSWE